ncbi:MAG TPA: ATP-binding protein, partial [Fimbriimonadaceae bacterium]|nr:ATP-binding protein [Fimbriimonadaceae bacterium]
TPAAEPQSGADKVRLEQRYRTLIEEIPAVTFFASLEGGANELYVSPQIEALLGFTQREWLEDPVLWFRQLHPEDMARWHEEFAKTLVTGEAFRSNYRFMAKDGRTVWVHGEAKVVRDAQGRPLFLQGIAFDITERIEAEQVLRRSREELERLVEQRTAELRADIAKREQVEETLRKANEQLRQKSEEIEQFVYAVSHDLKSPLVTCDNFAGLAAQDLAEGRYEELREDLNRIRHAVGKMRIAIEDLLELSRIGRISSELRLVDVGALVRQLVEEMSDTIRSAGAVVEIQPDMPNLWADSDRLASLFENLLSNALKYGCSDAEARVWVGGQQLPGEIRYFVRDAGPGIAPEFHKKVFGLFQRLDARKEGSGVGLAIVSKVAELHSGRAWVESQPGQGATFWVALPERRPGGDE